MFSEKLSSIVRDNPCLAELREEFCRLIAELLEEYRPLAIIVGGSVAKGRFVMGLSDIDVVLIVDSVGRGERFALKTLGNVNVEISAYTPSEVVEACRRGNQFIRETLIYGRVLVGEEIVGEIREMVEQAGTLEDV